MEAKGTCSNVFTRFFSCSSTCVCLPFLFNAVIAFGFFRLLFTEFIIVPFSGKTFSNLWVKKKNSRCTVYVHLIKSLASKPDTQMFHLSLSTRMVHTHVFHLRRKFIYRPCPSLLIATIFLQNKVAFSSIRHSFPGISKIVWLLPTSRQQPIRRFVCAVTLIGVQTRSRKRSLSRIRRWVCEKESGGRAGESKNNDVHKIIRKKLLRMAWISLNRTIA